MAILHTIDGEPRVIPDSLVENFLAKGYRRNAPGAVMKAVEPSTVVSTNPSLIPVNSASLKELIALPLVSTAIAKKVIAQRPYDAIEDLIAKVGEIDWVALQGQIGF